MQVLVKTGPRSTLWSTFPLPLVIQLQYTQVKLRKMYKFVSFSSFTGRFLDDLCFWITCFCCCSASSPRKLYDTRDTSHSSVTQIDFDDDKYRRRPALSWFAQILKWVFWSVLCLLIFKKLWFLFIPVFPEIALVESGRLCHGNSGSSCCFLWEFWDSLHW